MYESVSLVYDPFTGNTIFVTVAPKEYDRIDRTQLPHNVVILVVHRVFCMVMVAESHAFRSLNELILFVIEENH